LFRKEMLARGMRGRTRIERISLSLRNAGASTEAQLGAVSGSIVEVTQEALDQPGGRAGGITLSKFSPRSRPHGGVGVGVGEAVAVAVGVGDPGSMIIVELGEAVAVAVGVGDGAGPQPNL
jgi:hypothetical protein